MRQRVKDVVRVGDKLFANRYPVMSLWQIIAENIHVMRADFTRRRYFSEEFGSYLMSGRPARCHRDLSNAFSSMLRRDQWFHAQTDNELVNEDRDAKIWLDYASKGMRRAMYDRRASFVRATKEGDGDFCAFGNTVITRDVVDFEHLLYRCWHLRDVAWDESVKHTINTVHFDWKPQARQILERFARRQSDGGYVARAKGGEISPKVIELVNGKDDQAFKEIQCRRMVIPADEYDMPLSLTRGRPWVSVYVDCENETILEEVALKTFPMTIPRWATGGSMFGDQYAYSPSVIYSLPDARMYQQMMLSMLTASEMATFPPLIAVGEAINGAVNIYPSGVTQADADYDERTGEVLRSLALNFEGIKYGAEQMERLEKALDDSFFLTQIGFPTLTKEMTAEETRRLWEEFVTKSLPLFEPVEQEYNAHLCDGTFEDLLALGTFGPIDAMPQILRGRDISWQFDTPITVAVERGLTSAFQSMIQTISEGMQVDPASAFQADIPLAVRDSIDGGGAPAKWLRTPELAKQMADQDAQQRQAAAAAQQVATHADAATRVGVAAKSAGEAAQALQGAGVG